MSSYFRTDITARECLFIVSTSNRGQNRPEHLFHIFIVSYIQEHVLFNKYHCGNGLQSTSGTLVHRKRPGTGRRCSCSDLHPTLKIFIAWKSIINMSERSAVDKTQERQEHGAFKAGICCLTCFMIYNCKRSSRGKTEYNRILLRSEEIKKRMIHTKRFQMLCG